MEHRNALKLEIWVAGKYFFNITSFIQKPNGERPPLDMQ